MITVSGHILDLDTDLPVKDISYCILGTDFSVLASGKSNEIGAFQEEILPTTQKIMYLITDTECIGYNRVVNSGISNIVLFVKLGLTSSASVSGGGKSFLLNAPLTTSTNVIAVDENVMNIFVATDSGFDIIDINTLENIGYYDFGSSITSISIDNTTSLSGVLLGTTNSGVLEFNMPDQLMGRDLSSYITTKYKTSQAGAYSITSDNVQCISRSDQAEYLVGTESGVDYYTKDYYRRSHSYGEGVGTTACRITHSGDVFYSPTNSGLYVKHAPISADWSSPDYIINVGNSYGFDINSNFINDIEVTPTASGNLVFVATTSGALIYLENVDDLSVSISGSKYVIKYP